MAESKISLKLLVHKKTQTLAYAEADKDFVDFFFHNLSLPVGTLLKLLAKDDLVGSFGTLYKSVQDLPDGYMRPFVTKDSLLQPKITFDVVGAVNLPNGFLLPGVASITKKLYKCKYHYNYPFCTYVTDRMDVDCPACKNKNSMTVEVPYFPATVAGGEEAAASGDGVYVKGMVKYMVMDDLEVKPLSIETVISAMSKFKIMDMSEFDEQLVKVGEDEGIALLKAALHSKSVFTDVFLGKKVKSEDSESVFRIKYY